MAQSTGQPGRHRPIWGRRRAQLRRQPVPGRCGREHRPRPLPAYTRPEL